MRLFYPEIDRETLKPTGRSVVASRDIEFEMMRSASRKNFHKTLKNIVSRTRLSGHVSWNHGKDFEMATVLYLDTCGREIQMRPLVAGRGSKWSSFDCKPTTLPAYGTKKLEPKMEFVTSFLNRTPTSPCFYYSRRENDPVIDAYFVSNERPPTVSMMQMTVNEDHDVKNKRLEPLVKYISVSLTNDGFVPLETKIKFRYIMLTAKHKHKLFTLSRKNTVDIKSAEVEQYVAYIKDPAVLAIVNQVFAMGKRGAESNAAAATSAKKMRKNSESSAAATCE